MKLLEKCNWYAFFENVPSVPCFVVLVLGRITHENSCKRSIPVFDADTTRTRDDSGHLQPLNFIHRVEFVLNNRLFVSSVPPFGSTTRRDNSKDLPLSTAHRQAVDGEATRTDTCEARR